MLGAGGWGRLYKALVIEKQLAQGVACFQQGMGFSGELHVIATLKPGVSIPEVEKIVTAEIDRALEEPVSEAEMLRSTRGIEASFVWGLEELLAVVREAPREPEGRHAQVCRGEVEGFISRRHYLDSLSNFRRRGKGGCRDRRAEAGEWMP